MITQGNGINSSTAPVYQSECSPAHNRGALLTLEGVVTILGLCIGEEPLVTFTSAL
jgi:hypothetical protein